MNFSGKIALVTGGSHRIGRAIAIPLADANADVALKYKENKSTANELVYALSRQEQVADIAVMLARNGYITRQSINIDAGLYPSS